MRLLVLLALLAAPQSVGDAWITVLRVEGNQVLAEPLRPAQLTFRLEQGTAPETGPQQCRQRTEIRSRAGVNFPAFILDCPGGRRLVLSELSLQ